jgi:hypothetical protein
MSRCGSYPSFGKPAVGKNIELPAFDDLAPADAMLGEHPMGGPDLGLPEKLRIVLDPAGLRIDLDAPLDLPRGPVRHEREVFTTSRYPLAVAGIRLRFGLPAASAIATHREATSSTTR